MQPIAWPNLPGVVSGETMTEGSAPWGTSPKAVTVAQACPSMDWAFAGTEAVQKVAKA
ncbi:MAG: hypothetical protein Gyms2KO_08630 [Gymnodinialimonas sp.]